jgi:hypothetical protein
MRGRSTAAGESIVGRDRAVVFTGALVVLARVWVFGDHVPFERCVTCAPRRVTALPEPVVVDHTSGIHVVGSVQRSCPVDLAQTFLIPTEDTTQRSYGHAIETA